MHRCLATREALDLPLDLEMKNIVVEGDCVVVFTAQQSSAYNFSAAGVFSGGDHGLSFYSISFCFISRLGNSLVNNLASNLSSMILVSMSLALDLHL